MHERRLIPRQHKIRGNMDIGAVVVTYNRLEKLKTALERFDAQIKKPKYIIVVNNNSNDGTREFLDKWVSGTNGDYERKAIHKDINSGGSGGFYTGLEASLNEDCDWVWVSDDDAYPRADALKIASDYLDRYAKDFGSTDGISALCSVVLNKGVPDPYHSRSIYVSGITIKERFLKSSDYEKKEFERDNFSYVGSILSKKAMLKAGLPNKDYFIYCDDTEHAMRMHNYGKIVCLTDMKVDHEAPAETLAESVTWKTYYCYRNMTDMYRKHFGGIYFWWFAFKIRIKTLLNRLSGGKRQDITILWTAYNDAVAGKFGLHEVYRPGWKL